MANPQAPANEMIRYVGGELDLSNGAHWLDLFEGELAPQAELPAMQVPAPPMPLPTQYVAGTRAATHIGGANSMPSPHAQPFIPQGLPIQQQQQFATGCSPPLPPSYNHAQFAQSASNPMEASSGHPHPLPPPSFASFQVEAGCALPTSASGPHRSRRQKRPPPYAAASGPSPAPSIVVGVGGGVPCVTPQCRPPQPELPHPPVAEFNPFAGSLPFEGDPQPQLTAKDPAGPPQTRIGSGNNYAPSSSSGNGNEKPRSGSAASATADPIARVAAVGSGAPPPPPSFSEATKGMGLGGAKETAPATAGGPIANPTSGDNSSGTTADTSSLKVNAHTFFTGGVGQPSAKASNNSSTPDEPPPERSKAFTIIETPKVFAQQALQGVRAEMPRTKTQEWMQVATPNGDTTMVPVPFVPEGGHPNLRLCHCHSTIYHPAENPDVSLHLYYYTCFFCEHRLFLGKQQDRPPDLKLGGISGDTPAHCIAHLLYATTGVRISSIDMYGKNFGRCNLWLEEPDQVSTLIRLVDRRFWMAPLVHAYAIVVNDDESREYLLWYLEGLRKHGPTKVRFPRHMATAERWTLKPGFRD